MFLFVVFCVTENLSVDGVKVIAGKLSRSSTGSHENNNELRLIAAIKIYNKRFIIFVFS
jgi:hypothetical protein